MNKYNFYKSLSEDKYLYNQVEHCICGYKKLLLSYSGGLDSTVLLDILSTLIKCSHSLIKLNKSFSLRAIYVNHGLSIHSINWSNHCAQQCKIRNIPFHIIQVNDHNFYKRSNNIEAMARMFRYQELCNDLHAEEVLLTAHHMDDQVETVLLALKRGSGPAGLSGIHKNIMLNNSHRVLRPLLECSRTQLESYAYRKNLTWVKDDTNENIYFDRNFLRINVIPLLKKRWPSFSIVVKRTAELCRNQENLLKELLLESLKKLIDLDGSLYYYPLLQCSSVKRHALLRYWLSNFFINMPSYQLLNRIWQEVILSKSDANPILNLGTHVCRRFRKKLYILPIDMISIGDSLLIPWNMLNNTVLLPSNLGLLISKVLTVNINEHFFQKSSEFHVYKNNSSSIFWSHFKTSGKILTNCLVRAPQDNETVSIRFGHVSGVLHILNRNRGRKLKKIWQELNIPPWLRHRIPLLFYDNQLIAAIGVFITQDGKIKNTTNAANDQHVAWNIVWMQEILYYSIFKNTIRCFLK